MHVQKVKNNNKCNHVNLKKKLFSTKSEIVVQPSKWFPNKSGFVKLVQIVNEKWDLFNEFYQKLSYCVLVIVIFQLFFTEMNNNKTFLKMKS